MTTDLFGEEYLSITDYARKLVTRGYSRPFYEIKVFHKSTKSKEDGYDIRYFHHTKIYENDWTLRVSINEPGLYAIYRKIESKMECLYVGFTNHSMTRRVYRFIKELDDNSRGDESHPAARKARLSGVKSTDSLHVVTLPLSEFPETNLEKRFVVEKIDEAVASLLDSKFNEKLKK